MTNQLDTPGIPQFSRMDMEHHRSRSDRDRSTPDLEFLERQANASPGAVHPHHLVFTILIRGPDRKLTKSPLTSWSILYPTLHAAQSQMRFIQGEMHRLRGLNPWTEIARITKCKAGALLAKHQNLQMSIQPKDLTNARPAPISRPAVRVRPNTQPGPVAPAQLDPASLDALIAQHLLARGLVAVPIGSPGADPAEGAPPPPGRGPRRAKRKVPSAAGGVRGRSPPGKGPAKARGKARGKS